MKLEAGEASTPNGTHLIRRPRLTTLLEAVSARIILLVAPAGYGKTILAREWLDERPHAWYRGNAATGDVAELALGMATACATIIPGAADRLMACLRVSREPADEVHRLADLLAEDLGSWPPEAWIGFDDYQFACDSDSAEMFVELLLQRSDIRVLVASRSRPRWATARRALYGEVFEVGRSLLAMTREEALDALRHRSNDTASSLLSLADGWPALIGIAAHSPGVDMPGLVFPDELYAFFAEELYNAASVTVQQALRRLSLAPYLTLDIVETLVDGEATPLLAEGVERGFLIKVSHDRFELHPLLRLFLESKFRRRHDDPTGRRVNNLVHVLISLEEWEAVFALALRLGDDAILVRLFEAALSQALDEARLATLKRWIAVATGRGIDSPVIDLADAELTFRQGQLPRAEALACQAARRLDKKSHLRSRALWISGTTAHLTYRDEASLKYFRSASAAATNLADRRQALWGEFLATESLERGMEAEALLRRFIQISGRSVDDLLRIAAGKFRIAQLNGAIGQALRENESLIHVVSRSRDPLIRSSFLNTFVAMLTFAGQYERAVQEGEEEIRFALASSLDFVLPFAYLLTATASLGLRDMRRCRANLNSCRRVWTGNHFIGCNMSILHARLQLASQQPDQALKTLEDGQSLAKVCKSMEAEYFAWWSLAHAAASNHDDATELAARAEACSTRIEVSALTPWIRVILACEAGDSADVMAESAFATTLQTGNVDAFVAAYRACPRILMLIVEKEQFAESLREILHSARDHALAATAGLRLRPGPVRAGPLVLTKREQEVIELVSQGLTNKQIARALFITEATVKVHVRKICQKLGVRSRTEAAIRAAELSG
jgi:ATP/maltotriose-dependent transcriptional regulator MalT